jgi:N-acetylmuramoyl-L-alanine amidase
MTAMRRSPLPYLLILTLVACGPKPKPRPPLTRFYDRLQEPLDSLDFGSIRGRRIVIDPGHGGVFRGAIGLDGLDEADVNLGVALYLWGLLDEAGAEVHLTRKTDRDFVDRDSLALRRDLEARVEFVKRIRPDVFISLHHNAHFAGDRTYNEIQIYHKMGDEGPSLDIARIVARHLRGNIGEAKTRVLPGNYYVLRNSDVPSILCEPSFISNPDIESRLKLSDKQRLEAEVYFLSLVDYFSRGIPRITHIGPEGPVLTASPKIDVVFDSESSIDLSSVDIVLDGTRLRPFQAGPNAFAAFPLEPLRGGSHTLRARGRAVGGNSTSEAVAVFEVDLEPRTISLEATPETGGAPYPQKVSVLVLDEHGNPMKDGTQVEFKWEGGRLVEETLDGRASVFVGIEIAFGTGTVTAACEDISGRLALRPSSTGIHVSGFVLDTGGSPIAGAAVTAADPNTSAITDHNGFFALGSQGVPGLLEASKVGFKKASIAVKSATYPTIEMKRFYSGIETGLTVAIDPEGGGTETGWVGPTGIAASDLNLEVAHRLADALRSAGVEARLTRDADLEVAGGQRVTVCESNHSALLVSLSHAETEGERVLIEHFPESRGGLLLSGYLVEEMKASTRDGCQVGETADYIIQQTSCPAVKITFPAGKGAGDEAELADTFNLWRRAYPVSCAILRYLGVDKQSTFTAAGRVTSGGKPVGHAVVMIDGNLEILADARGGFTARLLEAGSHTAQAFARSMKSESVRFDGSTGSLSLELAPVE